MTVMKGSGKIHVNISCMQTQATTAEQNTAMCDICEMLDAIRSFARQRREMVSFP